MTKINSYTTESSAIFTLGQGVATAELSEYRKEKSLWRLNRIITRIPRKGYGTLVLKRACEFCDRNRLVLQNEVIPYHPISWGSTFEVPELRVYFDWYKKYGFILKSSDLKTNTGLMIRPFKLLKEEI